MDDPNLGISKEDTKKLESYFKATGNNPPTVTNPEFVPSQEYVSSTDTSSLCVGISQAIADDYFNTHSPDLERTETYFGEVTANDLSNPTSSFTLSGFSFQVIKEENGNPKIIIKVNEDIKDLTVELKTGGRIIGVNTLVNTSE